MGDAEEAWRIKDRQAEALEIFEKGLGRPVFSAASGLFPDTAILRGILLSWIKAYGLDEDSLEPEQISLLLQSLYVPKGALLFMVTS